MVSTARGKAELVRTIHWDLVKDLHHGSIELDGTTGQQNGIRLV